MKSLCRELTRRFAAGEPSVLVTVMDQEGSAPRSAGARMLVAADGGLWGTVGGGRYEAEAIHTATVLHALYKDCECPYCGPRPGHVLEFSLHGVTDMDMICGGRLSLLLEYLPAKHEVADVFSIGLATENEGKPFVLFSYIRDGHETPAVTKGPARPQVSVERSLCAFEEGAGKEAVCVVPQERTLPESIMEFARGFNSATPCLMSRKNDRWLLEFFACPSRVFIFGGGHVSREVADIAAKVGFQVHVYEDRPEFLDSSRFPGAETRLLPSLKEDDVSRAFSRAAPGKSDALVIVTRGHSHDRDVLAAALPTHAGYIGMIGSKSKRAAVYAQLRDQGVPQERLDEVYSPIGLAIGAETPQEIAVSIVGELIAWRAGRAGRAVE